MGRVNHTSIKLETQRLVNPNDRSGMPKLAVSTAKTFLVPAKCDKH
jgi:hypothetical protein